MKRFRFHLKSGDSFEITAEDVNIKYVGGDLTNLKWEGGNTREETLLWANISEITAITYKETK